MKSWKYYSIPARARVGQWRYASFPTFGRGLSACALSRLPERLLKPNLSVLFRGRFSILDRFGPYQYVSHNVFNRLASRGFGFDSHRPLHIPTMIQLVLHG